MSEEGARAPHVLVCPFPASGHLIPLLDFTRRLVPFAAITILVTPQSLPLISAFLSSHPDITTLVLPLPPHPSIPSNIHNFSHLPTRLFPAVIHALANLHDPLISWFRSHPSPPRFIVSDMFLAWTHRVASQILGVKNIVFSPSAAMTISTLLCLWEDLPTDRTADFVSFDRVPNCPKYPWWQISPLYRSFLDGNPDAEFVKEIFNCNAQSWGIVINTFEELERPYLDHLRKRLGSSDRVWAVGPLLPAPHDQERGGTSSIPLNSLITWLDLDGCRDVVYVCFGSRTVLNEDQTARVASGLEKSGVRFVWSVGRHVDDRIGRILTELEERVGEKKALVIRGWAPQVAILSHRAVGAFLTHCGWNSVLEGIVAGVTMLTWAMTADQFMDAKLLVDELKVGVRVYEGGDALPDPDELGRVVAEAVSEKRLDMRERVSRLRSAAVEAIGNDGGSSAKDFERLVKHLAVLES